MLFKISCQMTPFLFAKIWKNEFGNNTVYFFLFKIIHNLFPLPITWISYFLITLYFYIIFIFIYSYVRLKIMKVIFRYFCDKIRCTLRCQRWVHFGSVSLKVAKFLFQIFAHFFLTPFLNSSVILWLIKTKITFEITNFWLKI
jgi:hypothetical protein